jgi:hypothetical protein
LKHAELGEEMIAHQGKEEFVLFPYIGNLNAGQRVSRKRLPHVPRLLCRLLEFERDLQQHIHLGNNILSVLRPPLPCDTESEMDNEAGGKLAQFLRKDWRPRDSTNCENRYQGMRRILEG